MTLAQLWDNSDIQTRRNIAQYGIKRVRNIPGRDWQHEITFVDGSTHLGEGPYPA